MKINLLSFLALFASISSLAQKPYSEVIANLESTFDTKIYCPSRYQPSSLLNFEDPSEYSLEENLVKITEGTVLSFLVYDKANIVLGPKNLLTEFKPAPRIKKTNEIEAELQDQQESYTIGSSDGTISSQGDDIRLYIFDDNVKEPLIGVTAQVASEGQATISNEVGLVELSLGPGTYEVEISYLGYISKTIELIVLGEGRADVSLSKEAYKLQEVTISASSENNSINREEIGLEALSAKEIQRLPALMGEADVIKSLLLLPGVSTVGEGSSGINIRGGSVDQNLIMQDGTPLFNASHVLGLFSLFNPDIVKSIELYKGSLPARFGGRVSSVMDVELKEGNVSRWKGRGGLGLISSRLTLEGPIVPEKVSLIVGGRLSFSDYIFQRIRIAEIRESRANFYDANAKLTIRMGGKGKLNLAGYTSFDRFKFSDKFDFRWSTNALNANFNYILNPYSSIIVKSSISDYASDLINPALGSSFNYDNGIRNIKVKPYLQMEGVWGLDTYLGVEMNQYSIRSGSIEPTADDSPFTSFELDPQQGLEFAGFVDLSKEFASFLQLSVGLRYSHFRNLGPGVVKIYEEGQERLQENLIEKQEIADGDLIKSFNGLEPRTSLKINTGINSSLKTSFNITRQYISQLFNTTSVTPVDLWYASNSYIDPLSARNYSLGYFFGLNGKQWENSVELFYRDIENTIEYKDIADLFLNEFVETELLNATGRAYGLELSVKKNVGRVTGRFSYTYSRTESKTNGQFPKERINNNNWFPSNYDRPHDLSLTSSFQITKRSFMSVNFVYSSGRPVSAPTGNISVGNVKNIPVYGARNNYRIPDYHRLDFAYTVEPSHRKDQKWKSSFTFSVYNVYGRRNAFSVFFTQRAFQSPVANRLAILARPIPSITYNFNF